MGWPKKGREEEGRGRKKKRERRRRKREKEEEGKEEEKGEEEEGRKEKERRGRVWEFGCCGLKLLKKGMCLNFVLSLEMYGFWIEMV